MLAFDIEKFGLTCGSCSYGTYKGSLFRYFRGFNSKGCDFCRTILIGGKDYIKKSFIVLLDWVNCLMPELLLHIFTLAEPTVASGFPDHVRKTKE